MKNEDTPKIPSDDEREQFYASARRESELREIARRYVSLDVSGEWDWYESEKLKLETPSDFRQFISLCSSVALAYQQHDYERFDRMHLFIEHVNIFGRVPSTSFDDLPRHLSEMSPRKARLYCEELLRYRPLITGRDLIFDCLLFQFHVENVTNGRWELNSYTDSDWDRIPDFLEVCKRRELAELEPTVKPQQSKDSNVNRPRKLVDIVTGELPSFDDSESSYSVATTNHLSSPNDPEQRSVWKGKAVTLARQEYPKYHGRNLADVEVAEQILREFIVYRSGLEEHTKESFARNVTTAKTEFLT